jgi:hypothetical protein
MTPIDTIRRNALRMVSEGIQPVVLLSTGSLSPVHRMHINVFQLAKRHLEGV